MRGIGIEQPVQMDDEIAHVSVVDRLLGLCLPGGVGGCVVGIDANNVESVQVLEFGGAELGEFAAQYEMEKLVVSGHDHSPSSHPWPIYARSRKLRHPVAQ